MFVKVFFVLYQPFSDQPIHTANRESKSALCLVVTARVFLKASSTAATLKLKMEKKIYIVFSIVNNQPKQAVVIKILLYEKNSYY